MDKKILVINIGSASKKCGLYDEHEVCGVHMEKTSDGYIGTIKIGDDKEEVQITQDDYDDVGAYLMRVAGEKNIAQISDVTKIGLRVVAPGVFFQEDKIIDGDYIQALTLAQEMAPLHIIPVLEELKRIKNWAGDIPLLGISDSAFYKDMPIEAKLYGLPKELAEEHGIYRYGYHGISMSSVLGKIKELKGDVPEKIIICHLGSGSTVTALKNGRPIDTSMGFTPLEGIPTGSRVGNIDAGAVLYLLKKGGLDASVLEEMLYKKSGLLGLSGKTPFVKELIDLEKEGDIGAGKALAVFTRAVKKYIGAYSALLGGLDLLVFTATIGERSEYMRSKICSGLEYLDISSTDSPKVVVIPTDEMSEMAKRAIYTSGDYTRSYSRRACPVC